MTGGHFLVLLISLSLLLRIQAYSSAMLSKSIVNRATALARHGNVAAMKAMPVQVALRSTATNAHPQKSWVPTEQPLLQKVTTQALIHEISLQQMEAAAKVVPWFLKNMPVSSFRAVATLHWAYGFFAG